MGLSFHSPLLRVALTDALAPSHTCAACFFILRPGAGIRVNHCKRGRRSSFIVGHANTCDREYSSSTDFALWGQVCSSQ